MLRFLLSLMLIWCISVNCLAEIWPTYSIVQAVRHSEKVVLAKFLKIEENDFYFIYKDLEDSTGSYSDTLIVSNVYRRFERQRENKQRYGTPPKRVQDAEALILFLCRDEKNNWQPIFSGWRFLIADTIYQPFQLDNPGGFHILPIGEKIDWQTLQTRIKQAQTRIHAVLDLQKIENDTLRNQTLLKWLHDHPEAFQNEYDRDCTLNEDCGWAFLNYDMLNWILEAGIAEHAWEVGLFGLTINRKNFNDGIKQSFTFPAERQFLLEKATTDTVDLEVRKLALRFLINNLWLRMSWDKTKRNGIQLTPEEQLHLMKTLKPLLYHEELAKPAFQVLSKLSNPRDGALKDRINLTLLPDFIEKYQSLPPVQNSSDLRIQLGEFMSYNADEATWKAVSGSDANQYFKVYHFYTDTVKNVLRFHFYSQRNKSGRKSFQTKPIVELKRIENMETVETLTRPINNELEDFARLSGGAVTLNFNISNLKKGTYHFKIIGKTGEKNEYNFVSEIGQFTL